MYEYLGLFYVIRLIGLYLTFYFRNQFIIIKFANLGEAELIFAKTELIKPPEILKVLEEPNV